MTDPLKPSEPDDTAADRKLFYRWDRVTRRAHIERPWERLVAQLEAAHQRGLEWTDEENATLGNALLCWDNIGRNEAADWDDEKLLQFKREWAAWREEAEVKLAANGNLTLDEERYRAHSQGVWWVVGFREGDLMNSDAAAKFKEEWRHYAEEEQNRSSSGRVRTLQDEKHDAWGCGVWQAEAERQKAHLSQATLRVIEAALARLRPWPETLVPEDYDFSAWVDAISNSGDDEEQRSRLMAGVFYEYARESEKLRGLLTLLNPGAGEDEKGINRPGFFNGLEAGIAEKALGNWFLVLLELADELAANVPFAKVDPKRLDSALFFRGTDQHGKPFRISRLKSEFGRTVWHVPPVAPAYETHRSVAAGRETMLDWYRASVGEESLPGFEPRKRVFQTDHDKKECEEVLLVRVNWRFTDEELGEAFRDFTRRYRPVEKFEEPERKSGRGTGREIEWTQHLSALAALRLGHALPFHDAEAEFRKVKSKLPGSPGATQERRKFEAKREQAVKTFGQWFPFGEKPHHHLPWNQRVEAESK